MEIVDMCDYIQKENLEVKVVELIYDAFRKRRGHISELEDMIGFVKIRQVFDCKITTPEILQEIRKFLMNHEKGKHDQSRTSEAANHRSAEPSQY